MAITRKAEYKPLSFSTTMRNPERIVEFLNCILPFEGKILTNEIIHEVTINLISKKLYFTQKYEMIIPEYKAIYVDENAKFTREQVEDIIENSPQNHKEAGFEKGWPSRFDTWYKLPMEFGFIYYEMNKPIEISITGHMLIDALNENPKNDEKIRNVFLNALMKYQTNNPFRKNANANAALPLLLKVIKLLKEDSSENNAGVFRKELSLLICWPDNDAEALYAKIKEIRKKYGYTYGDEVIYEICLKLLNATNEQKNRFKINQITGEAVDEFIRKMRITGVVSLRGNGRFLDFNSFEINKIDYILDNYYTYRTYTSKYDYFKYMGEIDNNILEIKEIHQETIDDVKIRTLNKWASEYSKDDIIKELNIVCGKTESKNDILRIIDRPTRLEFLTSIALKQNFADLEVYPNYHIDDEGIPTFTASGGMADIECFDKESNPLVEVTLMCARNQATNEVPAITRHLQEAVAKYPSKIVFTILVAPSIHADTIYMTEFSKSRYKVDILPMTVVEFVKQIQNNKKIVEFLS